MQERLAKVLAAAGIASRRDAEQLIAAGKVAVNGEVVTAPGRRVDRERDTVTVEGRALPRDVERLYLALHKPRGCVVTRADPHAAHTVMELLLPALEAKLGKGSPAVAGLHPVGRLDAQSEGLLLLTNDGAFTHALTHPRHGVPKLYLAEVHGIPDEEALERLRTGVPLFGRRTAPARARVLRADRGRNVATVEVELREGRNQQVRGMLQAVGYPVTALRRVAIGGLQLGRMRPGQWRFLTPTEVAALQAGEVPPPPPAPRSPRAPRPASRRQSGPPAGDGGGPRPPRWEEGRGGGPRGPRGEEGRGGGARPPRWEEGRGGGPRGPRGEEGRGGGARPPRREEGRGGGPRPPRWEEGRGGGARPPRWEEGRGGGPRPPRREEGRGGGPRGPRGEEGRGGGPRPPREGKPPRGPRGRQ